MRWFTDLYKSQGGHYFVEPRFELFVCGDFVEKIAFDKPHFVRLLHDRVESTDVSVWSLRTPEGSPIIKRSSVIFVPMIGATPIWNPSSPVLAWNATVSAWPRSCRSCGGMSAG